MTPKGTMYRGSCLCGAVHYQVRGTIGPMANCYCTDCQKSHGAAFASYIDVPRDGFAFLKGANHVHTYKAASDTKRSFCRTCGSIVICWAEADNYVGISAATLDTPIALTPAYHCFVRSKPSWYEILDSAPQYERSNSA